MHACQEYTCTSNSNRHFRVENSLSLPAALFLILFIAGCVLAFIRHPIYGLMTYVGEYFIHPPSRWWGQGLLLDVRWSVLAAGMTLLAVLIRRSGRSRSLPFS